MAKGETYQSGSFDIANEFPITLAETYSDADLKSAVVGTVSGLQMGMEKFINAIPAYYTGKLAAARNQSAAGFVGIFGPAIVALVCNRSGSTYARGAMVKWYTKTGLTFTAGTITTATMAATFVANEEVGNFLQILDDAGAAGAAPEGECAQIIKNTTGVLTVQPAFTAAIANGDTGVIFSASQTILSASGDDRTATAGIVLAPDGIPDNYWGWVVRRGRVLALVKASTAISAGKSLIADTGRLTVSSTSVYGLSMAQAIVSCSNDIVSDLIPVYFDAWSPQSIST
jgi:hypothetical protein